MAKRSVRRPTEDIAIARITAQKGKGPKGDPTLLQKTVMDEDGTMFLVWCFHTTINTSLAYLWYRWRRLGEGGCFVDFLQTRGTIYKYQKAS